MIERTVQLHWLPQELSCRTCEQGRKRKRRISEVGNRHILKQLFLHTVLITRTVSIWEQGSSPYRYPWKSGHCIWHIAQHSTVETDEVKWALHPCSSSLGKCVPLWNKGWRNPLCGVNRTKSVCDVLGGDHGLGCADGPTSALTQPRSPQHTQPASWMERDCVGFLPLEKVICSSVDPRLSSATRTYCFGGVILLWWIGELFHFYFLQHNVLE